MARSQNLDPYLVPVGRGDLTFHQGVVAAWNSETNQNVINVAGSLIPDVPIVSTSDAIMMSVGDVVSLLRYRSTYFIIGRVVLPGFSNSFAMQYAEIVDEESTSSTSLTDLATVGPQVTVTISSSRRCLVHLSVVANVGALGEAGVGFAVDGATDLIPSLQMSWTNNNASNIVVPGSTFVLMEPGAVFPLGTLSQGANVFTMKYSAGAFPPPAASFAFRRIMVFPF